MPAGVRIAALGQPHELVGVVSVALARPASGSTREVLATVRARDVQSGAVFALRYRRAAGARGSLVRGGSQSTQPARRVEVRKFLYGPATVVWSFLLCCAGVGGGRR